MRGHRIATHEVLAEEGGGMDGTLRVRLLAKEDAIVEVGLALCSL